MPGSGAVRGRESGVGDGDPRGRELGRARAGPREDQQGERRDGGMVGGDVGWMELGSASR